MLINTQAQDAQTLGDVGEQQSMQINVTAQSFEHILSNLYSDPLAAIIRELTTNAVEAIQAAKKEDTRKVCIQLPTFLDPNLVIRDFGIGLDKAEVEKFLNCLFSSNKTNSNEFMGGFGLGSKSPLALVDCYSLSSVKDGIQHDFLYLKEPGKSPSTIYQGEMDTNSENGITVTIPLNDNKRISSDSLQSKAETAAKEQLLAFTNQVRIVTDASKDYDNMTDVTSSILKAVLNYDGTNVSLYTNHRDTRVNDSYYRSASFLVQIGSVTYPFTTEQQNIKDNHSKIKELFTNPDDICFVYKVPIGMLEIPMSRETINSTSHNESIILDYIKKAYSELIKERANLPIKLSGTFYDFLESIYAHKDDCSTLYKLAYNNMSTNDVDLYNDLVKTLYRSHSISYFKDLTDYDFVSKYFEHSEQSEMKFYMYSDIFTWDKAQKTYEIRNCFSKLLKPNTNQRYLLCVLDNQNIKSNISNVFVASYLRDKYNEDLDEENKYNGVILLRDADKHPHIFKVFKYILENNNSTVIDSIDEADLEKAYVEYKALNSKSSSYVAGSRESGYFSSTHLITDVNTNIYTSTNNYVYKKLKPGTKVAIPLSIEYLDPSRPNVLVLSKSKGETSFNISRNVKDVSTEVKLVKQFLLYKSIQVLIVPDAKYIDILNELKQNNGDFNIYGENEVIEVKVDFNDLNLTDKNVYADIATCIISQITKPIISPEYSSFGSDVTETCRLVVEKTIDSVFKRLDSKYKPAIDAIKADNSVYSTLETIPSVYITYTTSNYSFDFSNILLDVYKDVCADKTIVQRILTCTDSYMKNAPAPLYLNVFKFSYNKDEYIINPIFENIGL